MLMGVVSLLALTAVCCLIAAPLPHVSSTALLAGAFVTFVLTVVLTMAAM
jgi:hypothetical protein